MDLVREIILEQAADSGSGTLTEVEVGIHPVVVRACITRRCENASVIEILGDAASA